MNKDREPIIPLQVRLPASLHARLREWARAEDRSINNLLVRLLREAAERQATPNDWPA